jgi:hypothetical protein
MNQRITVAGFLVRLLCFSLPFLASPRSFPSFDLHCPHGRIEVAELTALMEQTHDPNVILRAGAIAGPSVLHVLHRLSKPGMSPATVAGAAQVSLARLGDESAIAELNDELNARIPWSPPSRAIQKLLLVANERAISILLAHLAAHPEPVTEGYAIDNPYDVRRMLIIGLANIVENTLIKTDGKYRGSLEDWVDWWTQGKEKPISLSIRNDIQDPYLECLCRKVEWGFPMGMVDLGATGDPRVVPIIRKLARMGYAYEGYVGSRSPYIWLRHDYVETVLAKWGDAEALEFVVHELETNAHQTAILNLHIIGGKKAMAALLDANVNPDYAMVNRPLFYALSQMVEDRPLPGDAAPTAKNLHKWEEWWPKNKDTAKFVKSSPYE